MTEDIDNLERLADLYREGLLTREEFEAQKKKLLGTGASEGAGSEVVASKAVASERSAAGAAPERVADEAAAEVTELDQVGAGAGAGSSTGKAAGMSPMRWALVAVLVMWAGIGAQLITRADPFISVWRIASDGESITLPLRESHQVNGQTVPFKYDFQVDWGDGSPPSEVTSFDDPDRVRTYAAAGDYTVTITGLMEVFSFLDSETWDTKPGADKLIEVPNLGAVGWKSLHGAFSHCSNLGLVAGGDTSSVTDMDGMFSGATSATPDTSGWDTSSVTSMRSMFYKATSAAPDTSGWNTSSVTEMNHMFYGAPLANPDVSNWNTSRVTNMYRVFSGATSAHPDVSRWDTSRVTDMTSMFDGSAANPDTLDWYVQQCARPEVCCEGVCF